jgi:hypothetical protein
MPEGHPRAAVRLHSGCDGTEICGEEESCLSGWARVWGKCCSILLERSTCSCVTSPLLNSPSPRPHAAEVSFASRADDGFNLPQMRGHSGLNSVEISDDRAIHWHTLNLRLANTSKTVGPSRRRLPMESSTGIRLLHCKRELRRTTDSRKSRLISKDFHPQKRDTSNESRDLC